MNLAPKNFFGVAMFVNIQLNIAMSCKFSTDFGNIEHLHVSVSIPLPFLGIARVIIVARVFSPNF